MRALALAALAACNVPATMFEHLGACAGKPPPPVHGSMTHDEDGDGTPDAVDVCPEVADDQFDSDCDGVGDACDPEPLVPNQTILFFAAMTPDDVTFSTQGAWTKQADAWR